VETESELLGRARALAVTDPRAAVALANEHARRFPSGLLGQEAEVIAIEALERAGYNSTARERLARFRKRFPSSVHLPHLENVVNAGKGSE
jgi:hypothetical protein